MIHLFLNLNLELVPDRLLFRKRQRPTAENKLLILKLQSLNLLAAADFLAFVWISLIEGNIGRNDVSANNVPIVHVALLREEPIIFLRARTFRRTWNDKGISYCLIWISYSFIFWVDSRSFYRVIILVADRCPKVFFCSKNSTGKREISGWNSDWWMGLGFFRRLFSYIHVYTKPWYEMSRGQELKIDTPI